MREKSFNELTFQDDFIFGVIMRQKKFCLPFLEIVLGIKIKDIQYPEYQKSIELKRDSRSVRLDVYVDDDKGTVYNIEMQTTTNRNLPKRFRYYQAMIDLNILDKGEDYYNLPKSFVIFVCTFDYYGKGKSVYRFENRCIDDFSLQMGDETVKIILNTKGFDKNTISQDLSDLLTYIDTGKVTNQYIQELDNEIQSIKSNDEWRRDYMTLSLAYAEKLQEGYREGKQAGRQVGLQEGRQVGLQEGRQVGLQEGKLKTLLELFDEGLLTVETFTEKAGCTVEEAKKIISK